MSFLRGHIPGSERPPEQPPMPAPVAQPLSPAASEALITTSAAADGEQSDRKFRDPNEILEQAPATTAGQFVTEQATEELTKPAWSVAHNTGGVVHNPGGSRPKNSERPESTREPSADEKLLQEIWRREAKASQQEVMTEHRTESGVEVRGVLCHHTVQNAANIAAALEGCDLVVFEGPFTGTQDQRADLQRKFSYIVRRGAEQPEVREGLTALAMQNDVISAACYNLLGTDSAKAGIAFIGPNREQWAPVKAAEEEANCKYSDTIDMLAPLDEIRAAGQELLKSYAATSNLIEQSLANDLRTLVDDAGTWGNGVRTIGVMLGYTHHQAVTQIGESTDPQISRQNAEKIDAISPPEYKAIAAMRNGDTATAAALFDRRILQDWITRCIPLDEQQESVPLQGYIAQLHVALSVEELVRELDDRQVVHYIALLERDLAYRAFRTKRGKKIEASLKPLLETLRDRGVTGSKS